MHCVCIGQDHKNSSTKSGRDPSRRKTREGVRRPDEIFQTRVTVRVPVLHCVCRAVHKVFVCVDLLKAKSEVLVSLKMFVLSVGTPKKLRQDIAKEFLSEQFKMYFLDAGIQREKTIPETPQQIVIAERCNRRLLKMARCLLIGSGLPKMMWGAASIHATKIRNLVLRRGEEKCTAELMRGIKPKLSISKLSIFGCTVFMRKRDRDVSKLEPKTLEGNFVGYTEGDNRYLVYIPNTCKIMAFRDVVIRSGLNP